MSLPLREKAKLAFGAAGVIALVSVPTVLGLSTLNDNDITQRAAEKLETTKTAPAANLE